MHSTKTLFHEEQQFRQPWLMALLIIVITPVLGLLLYMTVQQLVLGNPVGDKPMPNSMAIWFLPLMIVITGGVLWIFWKSKLVVDLDDNNLRIRFFPFLKREIPLEKIRSFKTITYRPIAEYGGWGVRWSYKGGKAYNVSGTEGIQFEFRNGEKLLIGSQKAQLFEDALEQAMRQSTEKI